MSSSESRSRPNYPSEPSVMRPGSENIFTEIPWRLIGRSLGQSLRLAHLALGSVCALIIFGGAWVLNGLWMSLDKPESDPISRLYGDSPFSVLGVFWPTDGPMPLERRVERMQMVFAFQGWVSGLVIAGAILIASLFLGTIARSTALDLAKGRSAGIFDACRMSLSRARSLLSAVAIPLVLVAVLWLGIEVFGLVLFSTDVASPVGGLLYVLPLLLGLGVAIFGLFFVFGHCMLAPASMVEDCDGLDALQRSWGYLVARPIRFLLYVALVGLIVSIAYAILQTVFRSAIDFAAAAVPMPDGANERPFAVGAIGFWTQMLWLVFIGWVISFYGAASTIVYLLMRSACDGQDVSVVAEFRPGH